MDNPYTAPATDVRQAEYEVAGAAPYTVAELRASFARFAWSYWAYVGSIVLLFGFLVAVGVQAALQGKAGSEAELQQYVQSWLMAVGFIGIFIIIVGVLAAIFSLILLYRYWAVMQPYTKRTTPGKAVGFLFIPIFNLYWLFVAYHGLAKDIDSYLNTNRDSVAPRPSSGLILSMVILFLISLLALVGNVVLLALVGNLAGLVLIVVLFLSKIRLNNSIIGIIQDRSRQLASAVPSK